MRHFLVYSLCLLMGVPPTVWAEVAQATAEESQASSKLAPQSAADVEDQRDSTPSRSAVLNRLHEVSWQFYVVMDRKLPGVLLQNALQAQEVFSPYHGCQAGPLTQEQAAAVSLDEVDSLLSQAQDTLGTFLQAQPDLGSVEFDSHQVDPQALLRPISVNGFWCVPQPRFSPPPDRSGQKWTYSRHSVREGSGKEAGILQTPLYVDLVKPDSEPVTNKEIRQWVAWISVLREFRNALAKYEAFHGGRPTARLAPDWSLAQETALILNRVLLGSAEQAAESAVRALPGGGRMSGRLTPGVLSAQKIYNASAAAERLPGFALCVSGGWCLKDGVRGPLEKLNEKIVLALQNPKLAPGAYLDALVMLAQQTAVVEFAATNTLLPKGLKTESLPNACRAQPAQGSESYLSQGTSDLEEILTSFGAREEREWWVRHLVGGVQELVFDLQLKNRPSIAPAPTAKVFEYAGERGNLYGFADSLFSQWLDAFFDAYREEVHVRDRPQWDQARTLIALRAQKTPFAAALRDQHGLDALDDFNSLLGEKLLLLFAAAREDLVTGLDDEAWEDRRNAITYLVQRAVESALNDSLMRYGVSFFSPELFVLPGKSTQDVEAADEATTEAEATAESDITPGAQLTVSPFILNGIADRADVFWRRYFRGKWQQLLATKGETDTWAIATTVVDALYKTRSMERARKQDKSKFDSDALALNEVKERVEQAAPEMIEAARAQETLEYMRTLMQWKNGPMNWVPGKSYESYTAGQYPGSVPACFSVPDGKGHGYGENTFGAMDPLLPTDYAQLQKGLALIALRSEESLKKRLSAQYSDSTLRRSLGISDSGVFARGLVSKFLELLPADPGEERGLVAVNRKEALSGFENWLDSPLTSKSSYDQAVRTLVENLFDARVRPLLEMSPGGEADQWETYLDGQLAQIFAKSFPLAKAPATAQLRQWYADSGMATAQMALASGKQVQQIWQTLSDEKVLEAAGKNWVPLCQTQPERCLKWIEALLPLFEGEQLKGLHTQATASLVSRILPQVLAAGTNEARLNFGKQRILRSLWLGELLHPREALFTPSQAPDTWVQAVEKALNESKAETQKAVLSGAKAKMEALLQERVQRAALASAQVDALLAQVKRGTPAELQSQVQSFLEANPEVFESFRLQSKGLLETAQFLLLQQEASTVEAAFAPFFTVATHALRYLSDKPVLDAFEGSSGEDIREQIVAHAFPSFLEFRAQAKRWIHSVTKPQVAPEVELMAVEKQQARVRDALADEQRRGKGEGLDARKVREVEESLQKRHAAARARYEASRHIEGALAALSPWVPAAKDAASAWEKSTSKPSNSALWTRLYQDHKEMRSADGVSPADTLEEINAIAAASKGTLEASVRSAKQYLEDLQQYCAVGLENPVLAPAFEAAFEKALAFDLQAALSPGPSQKARLRVSAIASIPHLGMARFLERVAPAAKGLRESLAQKDFSKLDTWIAQARESKAALQGFNAAAFVRESLPQVGEVCAFTKQRSQELLQGLEGLEPEQATPAQWRRGYWEFVETVSGVFHHPERFFAPLLQSEGEGVKQVWFRGAPSENLRGMIPGARLSSDATLALIEWFENAGSEEEVAAKLNAMTLAERSDLWIQVRDALPALMAQVEEGAPKMIAAWPVQLEKTPTDRSFWWERLDTLRAVWLTLADQDRRSGGLPPGSGAWVLATALVRTLLEGTLYRIENGALTVAESDPDQSKLQASLATLAALLEKGESAELTRLAQSAADVVLTSTRRAQLGNQPVHLPGYALEDSSQEFAPGTGFALFYARYALGLVSGDEPPSDILQWQAHLATAPAGRGAVYAKQARAFADDWAPGTQGQAAALEQWFSALVAQEGEQGFQTLRAQKATSAHGPQPLWRKYPTLEALKAGAEWKALVAFLEKWDRNGKATPLPETYPFFLAVLNWNMRHYGRDLALGPASPKQPLPESFLAYHMRDLVEELGLPLDDFQGWQQVLNTKSEPEDWAVMAMAKRSILVDSGPNRFFSALVDSTEVQTPYFGATYHFRPFPLVDGTERTRLASDLSFAEWYARSQDPRYYALYRVAEGDQAQVPLFKQLVMDGLQMQGESTLRDKDTLGTKPGPRSEFASGKQDWDTYFASKARALPAKRKQELIAAVRREFPAMAEDSILEVLQDRERLVAFRQAASELVTRYPHESMRVLGKGTDLARGGLFSLQGDLNRMVQAYARQTGWTAPVPELNVDSWSNAHAHREAAARAIYLASNLTFGKAFLGRTEEEQSRTERVLEIADGYYRTEAQAQSYLSALVAVNRNLEGHLTRLCEGRRLVAEVRNEEEFEAAKQQIWDLKLPLMDGVLEVAERMSPPGAGEEPRQMLRSMLLEAERAKAAKEKIDQWVLYGSMGGMLAMVLATRHPAIARFAASNPVVTHGAARVLNIGMASYFGYEVYMSEEMDSMQKMVLLPTLAMSPLVNKGMAPTVGWWLGMYFGNHAYEGYKEDFVSGPGRIQDNSVVRDTVLTGFNPLMTDESAAQRADLSDAIVRQQRAIFPWAMRLLIASITVHSVAVPLLAFSRQMPRYLVDSSRWITAKAWDKMSGGSFVQAFGQRQMLETTRREAQAALGRLGQNAEPVLKLGPEQAKEAVDASLLQNVQRKLRAWEADGQLVPSADMVAILLKDTRAQIKSASRMAQLDPGTLQSVVANPSAKLQALQQGALGRLRYLKDIEARLSSATPHVAVDDVTVLLSQQGSASVRHRPWYLQLVGLPSLEAAVWRVEGLRKIVDAGTDAHRALSFYYLSGWTHRANPALKHVAAQMGKDEATLLMELAEGQWTRAGRSLPVYGPQAELLREMAPELQSILRLGGLKMDAAMAAAVVRGDHAVLLRLYKMGPKQLVLEVANAQRLSPPKSNAAEAGAKAGAAAAEPLAASTHDWLTRMGRYNEELLGQFSGIRSYVERRLPERVGSEVVNKERLLTLVEKYSARDLQVELGAYLRTQGTRVDASVTELRLAIEIRRLSELDQLLVLARQRPTDGSVSQFFDRCFQTFLDDPAQVAGRQMSLTEARGVLQMDPLSVAWDTKDIARAVDRLALAAENQAVRHHSETVESAAQLLRQFARKERELSNLSDLMRVLELPPRAVKLPEIRSQLVSHAGELRVGSRLTHEEFMQVSSLFSRNLPTSHWQAESVLRLSLRRLRGVDGQDVAAPLIRSRAQNLASELEALGQSAQNVLEAERILLEAIK